MNNHRIENGFNEMIKKNKLPSELQRQDNN